MRIATLVTSLAVALTSAVAPVAAQNTHASPYQAAKKEGKISIWSSLETSLHQNQREACHPNAAKLWAARWATPEAHKIFYDEQSCGLLSGSTSNPGGEELEKLWLSIVFETADVEQCRRNLEMVAKAIDSLQ